jgi:squalene-associated FAD-dependent desaturase
MKRVTVVGAGWSGLACALTLRRQGAAVTLLDAAPQAGGRARRVDVALGDRSYALDNGQHLLVGAYRETLGLMRQVGIDVPQRFLQTPLTLVAADGLRLQAGRLQAPWHLAAALLTARGFSVADRVSILREVRGWRRNQWRLGFPDRAAGSVFVHATPRVLDRVWRPLCLAALNVTPESASAQILLNVLKASLGGAATDSDLMIARGDLSSVFPDAALRSLRESGATILLRTPGLGLHKDELRGWIVATRDRALPSDAVVLALPPSRAAALLASTNLDALRPAIGDLQRIAMAPIATVCLRYQASVRLPLPCIVLRDDPARDRFGQWAFDRGRIDSSYAGIVTVVVSGSGPHEALSRQELALRVAEQLSAELGLPPPLARSALVEKHATILPGPGLRRPPVRLPIAGILLASDSADSPYPSTLEGSVRSGLEAAQAALSA